MAPRKDSFRRKSASRVGKRNSRAPGGWLYGRHAVRAALANPQRRCRRLLVTAQADREENRRAAPGTAWRADHSGVPPEIVSPEEIERYLAPGASHQGVALLADPLPEIDLDRACRLDGATAAASTRLLMLDQVTDPRNVGAILRTAAAFGAKAVIQQTRHAPQASGALAKAASGALERVPLVRVTNLARALQALKAEGYWCLGLDPQADAVIEGADLDRPVCLVLGAEGPGLRPLVKRACDELIRLPISDAVPSLNVSVAAAIVLYESTRRRG